MNIEQLRITNLRKYLFDVVDEIVKNDNYQINVDMLSKDINNYSLDKIPAQSTVETWITGFEIHRDLFVFRSRMPYSQVVMENLANVGFFEIFEGIIKNKNNNGELPEIDGIESIECLNSGTMVDNTTNTCMFQIQLQITYTYDGFKDDIVSL